jgi:hypothetical protein
MIRAVASCRILDLYRRFRGTCCFHLQLRILQFRLGVLTEATMEMAFFWVRSRSKQAPLKRLSVSTSPHGAISQKTAIFILTAVRDSSHTVLFSQALFGVFSTNAPHSAPKAAHECTTLCLDPHKAFASVKRCAELQFLDLQATEGSFRQRQALRIR